LDKLRLRRKHRRQPETRIRVLRRRRIPLQRSSRVRRDSKHRRRTCRRGSNHRHRRQENLAPQDNLQQPDNPEFLARRLVLEQSVQQVLVLRRVLLPPLHPLRKSLLVF
jgi:hypothetical protein